ncbi:hypothetical protein QJS04_geneDACA007573 [Acorus gramineus]|uniref:Uncharacterized protein n=1 Tax=Acorus gramineus TaxID=55184 RepID=A0AAV9B7J7_ACOGR|nr:hypothetical protein QJS04_geneDACA007573 [Acorus gramineus]
MVLVPYQDPNRPPCLAHPRQPPVPHRQPVPHPRLDHRQPPLDGRCLHVPNVHPSLRLPCPPPGPFHGHLQPPQPRAHPQVQVPELSKGTHPAVCFP